MSLDDGDFEQRLLALSRRAGDCIKTLLRRFRAIASAALVLPSTGRAVHINTWRGVALGARATLRLAYPDAPEITARVVAEIDQTQ